jgi:hypothetical protein
MNFLSLISSSCCCAAPFQPSASHKTQWPIPTRRRCRKVHANGQRQPVKIYRERYFIFEMCSEEKRNNEQKKKQQHNNQTSYFPFLNIRHIHTITNQHESDVYLLLNELKHISIYSFIYENGPSAERSLTNNIG